MTPLAFRAGAEGLVLLRFPFSIGYCVFVRYRFFFFFVAVIDYCPGCRVFCDASWINIIGSLNFDGDVGKTCWRGYWKICWIMEKIEFYLWNNDGSITARFRSMNNNFSGNR